MNIIKNMNHSIKEFKRGDIEVTTEQGNSYYSRRKVWIAHYGNEGYITGTRHSSLQAAIDDIQSLIN